MRVCTAHVRLRAPNNMCRLFRRKLNLDTEYLMYRRIEFLSGIKPEFYDMCDQSCLLYVDSFHADRYCSICGNPRYHANDKPIARLPYLPIIPRLQGWYEGRSMIERLKYRSQYVHTPGEYNDVFDGSRYRSLLDWHVEVQDETLGHKYFSAPHDIALGGSTDGFR